jgi:nitrite reductase/ring-hydroxylating ferredoxin subunit
LKRLLTKLVYFFVIFQLVYLFTACADERDQIPNVRVDEYLDITTDLADLPVSGAKTWKGGFKGIIIFRLEPMVFLAYERTCPYYPKDDCAVDIKDVIFAECPCCQSLFGLPYNQLLEGPSKFPLKQYRTRIVGDRLHIYN